LERVPLIFAAFVPAVAPVMPDTEGADQEYVVPDGTNPLVPLTGVTVNVPPLQMVVFMLVMAGTGLTVTVMVLVVVQPGLTPVTVYVVVVRGDAVTLAPVVVFRPVEGAH